jgi:hypothetical protein
MTHAAAACTILLALNLQLGTQLSQHASYDDRIAWVLPPERLAAFARSGVVIDEDVRTTIVAHATAESMSHGLAGLRGTIFKQTTDVPRHRTQATLDDFTTTLTPENESVPAQKLDIEEAAMAELPGSHLCSGGTWETRLPVITTLGSGTATIRHTFVGVLDGIAQIDVRGSGVISGMEYNLPRLLPGTIAIRGTAWFDLAHGFLREESYIIDDRLIRTVKGKTIGFIETETVDETESAAQPAR